MGGWATKLRVESRKPGPNGHKKDDQKSEICTTSTEQKGHTDKPRAMVTRTTASPVGFLVTKTPKEFMHAVLAFNFAQQKTRKVQIHSQCDPSNPASYSSRATSVKSDRDKAESVFGLPRASPTLARFLSNSFFQLRTVSSRTSPKTSEHSHCACRTHCTRVQPRTRLVFNELAHPFFDFQRGPVVLPRPRA